MNENEWLIAKAFSRKLNFFTQRGNQSISINLPYEFGVSTSAGEGLIKHGGIFE